MYNSVYIVFFLKSKYLPRGKLVNKLQYISIMEYVEEYFQLESKFYIYLLIGKNISEITLKNPGYPKVYVYIYVFVHICICSPVLLKYLYIHKGIKDIYPNITKDISWIQHSHDFYTFPYFPHSVFRIHYFNNQGKVTFYKFKMYLQLVTLAIGAQFSFLIARTF